MYYVVMIKIEESKKGKGKGNWLQLYFLSLRIVIYGLKMVALCRLLIVVKSFINWSLLCK